MYIYISFHVSSTCMRQLATVDITNLQLAFKWRREMAIKTTVEKFENVLQIARVLLPPFTLQHAARYCNTLQHNATQCNTMQHHPPPSILSQASLPLLQNFLPPQPRHRTPYRQRRGAPGHCASGRPRQQHSIHFIYTIDSVSLLCQY